MSNLTAPRQLAHPPRTAITTMYVGLVCSVVAALAVLIDHTTGELLATHTREIYPQASAAELREDNAGLRTYLYGIGVLGVACWLWMAWAIKRRKRWARAVATTIFVLAGCVALFNLLAEEYGNRLLPTPLGLVGLLPCVAGAVTIALLWTAKRAPSAT